VSDNYYVLRVLVERTKYSTSHSSFLLYSTLDSRVLVVVELLLSTRVYIQENTVLYVYNIFWVISHMNPGWT
jgi:hypothetical protein